MVGIMTIEDSIRNNASAVKILSALSHGAAFDIIIKNEEKCRISREKCGLSFQIPSENRADFALFITKEVFLKIFSEADPALGPEDLLAASAQILSEESKLKNAELEVYSNLFKLTLHGYLKILGLGGVRFMRVLADNGLGSASAIKTTLQTLKKQ